jgi:hypothetical protein
MVAHYKKHKTPPAKVARTESGPHSRERSPQASDPTVVRQTRHSKNVDSKGSSYHKYPDNRGKRALETHSLKEVYAIRFSRDDWTKILVLTAAFALGGALLIDYLNSGRNVVRALVVVGPIIAFLVFGFWLFPSPKRIQIYLKSLQKPKYPGALQSFSRIAQKHLLPRVIPINLNRERQPIGTNSPGAYREKQEFKKKNLTTLSHSLPFEHKDVRKKENIPNQRTSDIRDKSNLKLWSDPSPRLNINLFESNVPTFVLSADQHFVDWNIGFELAFAVPLKLSRGQHVSEWFDRLDNFKRIAKRREQLYGEGILPITDRERATFKHPTYGRMVYTKIMSPIIDLKSSKIIGWTIILNINSVNKRQEFFEDLFRAIQEEGRRIRYRAAYPDVFKHYEGRRRLIEAHLQRNHMLSSQKERSVKTNFSGEKEKSQKVLIWGPDSVALTSAYIQLGYRVTVFSDDVHLLRRVRSDYGGPEPSLKLIRKESNQDLPEDYFNKASVMFDTGSLDHYRSILQDVYRALEPGGTLTLSAITDAAGLERIFQASFDALQQGGYMEQMKHQFHHVRDYALDQSKSPNHVVLDRVSLRELAMEAGFVITNESELHQEATTTLLVLKK